jgi:hypothetical protein
MNRISRERETNDATEAGEDARIRMKWAVTSAIVLGMSGFDDFIKLFWNLVFVPLVSAGSGLLMSPDNPHLGPGYTSKDRYILFAIVSRCTNVDVREFEKVYAYGKQGHNAYNGEVIFDGKKLTSAFYDHHKVRQHVGVDVPWVVPTKYYDLDIKANKLSVITKDNDSLLVEDFDLENAKDDMNAEAYFDKDNDIIIPELPHRIVCEIGKNLSKVLPPRSIDNNTDCIRIARVMMIMSDKTSVRQTLHIDGAQSAEMPYWILTLNITDSTLATGILKDTYGHKPPLWSLNELTVLRNLTKD